MLTGSLTLECAAVLMVFLLGIMTLWNGFFQIRTRLVLQVCLEETGSQLAQTPTLANRFLALAVFREKMELNDLPSEAIWGGYSAVDLNASVIMGREPYIDLRLTSVLQLPFPSLGKSKVTVTARCRKRAWGNERYLSDGIEEEEDTDDVVVYVTPNGKVYHRSLYCSYIRPVTEKVLTSSLGSRRNKKGGIYQPCELCTDGSSPNAVWITDWGTAWHRSPECRALWHDITEIPLSEAGERRPCSKCGGADNGND